MFVEGQNFGRIPERHSLGCVEAAGEDVWLGLQMAVFSSRSTLGTDLLIPDSMLDGFNFMEKVEMGDTNGRQSIRPDNSS